MPGILALDPGRVFGWAHFEPGQDRPLWGHTAVAAKGDEPGKAGAAAIILVEARIATFRPDAIAVESVYVPVPKKPRWVKGGSPFVFGAELAAQADNTIPMNPKVLARLYGFLMLIYTVAYRHKIPCAEATSHEVCAHFIGRRPPKGRDAKKAANQAMCRLLGWAPVTQDDADSLALGAYAKERMFPDLFGLSAGPLFVEKVL